MVEVHEFDNKADRDGFVNGTRVGEPTDSLDGFKELMRQKTPGKFMNYKIDGVIVGYDEVEEHFGVFPEEPMF